jgi:Mycothiol maleylpyruvate isomerase N-terminal domain
MSEKSENIAELESALARFRAKIAPLPDGAWAERWLGEWTLNELTAHMSGWANEMAAALGRVAAGERPTPEGVDYSDFDAWNAGFAGKAVAKVESLATFDASFKAYIDGAKALPEDLFGKNEAGKLKIGSRLLEGAGIHHFAEHGEQLDTWLASRK